MPVLKNPKHERLAQELAKGRSATDAMEAAGYSDPRNSTRLTKNDEIQARVAELQERGAKRVEVTVESLIAEAEEARQLALAKGQCAAAVAATREKGVLSGKRIERSEMGKPGDFDRMDDDELDAFIARRQAALGGGNSRTGPENRQTRERGKSSGLH